MKPENRVNLTTVEPVDPFGNVSLIDPDRLAELSAFRWYVRRYQSGNYVCRYVHDDGRTQNAFLHHAVFGPVPEGFEIDHRNGNPMDNRRSNLRSATKQQNNHNSAKAAGCSSPFKGVFFAKRKWCSGARCPRTGRFVGLGLFDPTPYGEIAAARIYDDFARMWFGEFARLNFPNDSTAPRSADAQSMQKH